RREEVPVFETVAEEGVLVAGSQSLALGRLEQAVEEPVVLAQDVPEARLGKGAGDVEDRGEAAGKLEPDLPERRLDPGIGPPAHRLKRARSVAPGGGGEPAREAISAFLELD